MTILSEPDGCVATSSVEFSSPTAGLGVTGAAEAVDGVVPCNAEIPHPVSTNGASNSAATLPITGSLHRKGLLLLAQPFGERMVGCSGHFFELWCCGAQPIGAIALDFRRDVSHSRQYGDLVAAKNGISGEDRQSLELRLRDQETIEWIAVMWLKCGYAQGVTMRDGQALDPGGAQPSRDVGLGGLGEWQPANRVLDRDLPRACRREQKLSI